MGGGFTHGRYSVRRHAANLFRGIDGPRRYRRARKIWLAGWLVTGLTSGSWSPAGAAVPGDVVMEPTSLTMPDGEIVAFELGTLYVPENRSKPDSRVIGIGFARFRGREQSGAPPIFALPGGPGISLVGGLKADNRDFHGRWLPTIRRYQAVSDLILIDQRGFSERGEILTFPHTWPPPAWDRPGSLERSVAQSQDYARAAVAHFNRRGVDLSGYTVRECAEDVNDLRKALHYGEITLIGTSFGSQWSLALIRLHPEIVARALLSGVEPLNHGYDMPSHVLAAYQRMWWAVEQDERFKTYVPPGGIAAAVLAIQQRLREQPVRISTPDEATGKPLTLVLGPEDFRAMDPLSILSVYYGHYDAWAERAARARRHQDFEPALIRPLIDTSLGVTPERRYHLWNDAATAFIGRENFASDLATADIWPTPDVGDDFRRPVETNVPVVFAQGDWDTLTPIENTYELAPFFRRSRVLTAERGGHGVLEAIGRELPETWKSLDRFLRTGDLSAVPARVVLPPSRTFEPPAFAPPSGSSPSAPTTLSPSAHARDP